jgi:dipeptidyl aminopeptidase/acylaminoacyl peptidase
MRDQVMQQQVMHKPYRATGGPSQRRWAGAIALALTLTLGAASGQTVGGDTARSAPAAAAATAAAAGASDSPALLPVEMFYRHADIGAARLSPSGKRLAVSVSQAGRVALAVFDLAGGAPVKIVAYYDRTDVRSFAWVNDERLVFNLIELDAGGGDQRWGPGLLSVGLDGARPRLLVRTNRDFVVVDRSPAVREPLDANHALLAVPLGGGDEVVVGKFKRDGSGELQAVLPLKLNALTGRTQSLAVGMPEGVTRWWFDPQGEPRVGESQREGQVSVFWRAPGTDTWALLDRFPALARKFRPREVDAAGKLYVTVDNTGDARTSELRRFDFAAGKPEAEALVRTPGFDFQGGLVHDLSPLRRATATALGVRVLTDAETTVWFDERLTRLQKLVDAKLPGHTNRISCRSCGDADGVLLVQSWSDQDPSQFWIYQAAGEVWQRVGAMRKDIEPRRMATLDFHRFKARDGLEIPVWVTLPSGPKPSATPIPRPAVVVVHGGPWVRGRRWEWDGEAQFLASRGYVVIEPEFRGSTGFGDRLFRAGFKQWGQAMQDDLADALQWAVGQGWVDPKRVCIVGGGYGGYAALMGLVRQPELYRCGVALGAISDPRLMLQWNWRYNMSDESRLYALPQLIGDPVTDAGMLAAMAPVVQAARIRLPLLLVHGQQDEAVPIEHGEKLRSAMRAAGQEPAWVVYADEGHGLLRPDNRFDFARRMERFLAQHLQAVP